MSFHLKTQHAALALSGLALISLAACREENRRPADAGPLFVPAAGAPQPYDVGVAPPPAGFSGRAAPRGPYDDGYGYAERAYELDRTFYESAPDYGFVYDGVEPWVWESDDDWLMYAEPLAVGFRYYYYQPGADYPYFVRDPDYAYGYDHGRLTTIYDGRGRLLPATYLRARADRADRYRDRAHALREAAARRRIPVAEDRWRERRPAVVASQSRWIQAAERQPDWKRYRASHDRGGEARVEVERERRASRPERLEQRPEQRQDRREWKQADRRQPAAAADAPPPIRAVRRDDQRRAEAVRPDHRRPAEARGERRDRPARIEAARPGPERVERQARREEPRAQAPVRQARAERPERVERPDRQVQRVERADRDAARPREEMRQARREARAAPQVQQQQPAAPPARQARAERPAPAAAQAGHAAQAGRDASARADRGGRGHGKPDKD